MFSIVYCSKCNCALLEGATSCHQCGTETLQIQVQPVGRPVSSIQLDAGESEEVCRTCGETYRTGLVRCWNCGSFTRPDIEEAYRRKVGPDGRQVPELMELPVIHSSQVQMEENQAATLSEFEGGEHLVVPSFGLDLDDDGDVTDAADSDFGFELDQDTLMSDDLLAPVVESPSVDSIDVEPIPLMTSKSSSAAQTPVAGEASTDSAAQAPSSEKPETPPKEAKPSKRDISGDGETVSHSEASGGDVLLKIALDEERSTLVNRKKALLSAKDVVLVYCPMGCKIRVPERHRGKVGKCPKCGSMFMVPTITAAEVKKRSSAQMSTVTDQPAEPAPNDFADAPWLENLPLHTVVPQKLKLVAGSLQKDFQPADVILHPDRMLIVTYKLKAGLFGAGPKKAEEARAALKEFLKTNTSLESAPNCTIKEFKKEELAGVTLGFPTPPQVESIFMGVPVFGPCRMGVRLPRTDATAPHTFLSFDLAGFRSFSASLKEHYGVTGLGDGTDIPLATEYQEHTCYYNETPVLELVGVPYYQADKSFKVELTGYRCGACKLIVGEDARKKEKIGGANGKGLAKAKCPKCSGIFGSNPLYRLAEAPPAK